MQLHFSSPFPSMLIKKSNNTIKKSISKLIFNTLQLLSFYLFLSATQAYYVLTFCTTAFSADSFWAEAFFCCSSSS